jgi:CBS domain-containing protein
MPKKTAPKSRPRTAKLGKILTKKHPLLHPKQSVQEAGEKMRDLSAKTLPVSDGRRLVGIVDQTNPDRRAAGFGHDPSTTTVGNVMNRTVAYCFENDDCAEALRRMKERRLDRLPVVDREMHIVGVVTREDLTECSPA